MLILVYGVNNLKIMHNLREWIFTDMANLQNLCHSILLTYRAIYITLVNTTVPTFTDLDALNSESTKARYRPACPMTELMSTR